MLDTLSTLGISIFATFNFCNFQFNSSKLLIYGKKYINHFQFIPFKFDNFTFWQFSKILTFCKKYWNHFQLCQLSHLAIFNSNNFQFWRFSILAIFKQIFWMSSNKKNNISIVTMDQILRSKITWLFTSDFFHLTSY